MAKLKIVREDGSVLEGEITPAVEYLFELHHKMGFHRAFRDEEKQTMVYWLAWEAERRAGITVVPFGEKYLETLAEVKVEDADSPNG
jgi:hypothetical protein